MALFSWLFGAKKHKQYTRAPSSSANPQSGAAPDSVLHEVAEAFGTHAGGSNSRPENAAVQSAAEKAMQQRREQRKADRSNRREALFGVVRECMLRAGILSSAYKFKVLSIDQKGRNFLVLIDLAIELARNEPPSRLQEIEDMIAETATQRLTVKVQAVYFRYYSQQTATVAREQHSSALITGNSTAPQRTVVGGTGNTQPGDLLPTSATPRAGNASTTSAADSITAVLAARSAIGQGSGEKVNTQSANTKAFSATVPLRGNTLPAQQGPGESLDQAELIAFQRALREGSKMPSPLNPTTRFPETQLASGSQFPDYAKTEITEDTEYGGLDNLSPTQHGDLR